jgi:hypothetical protein
MSIRGYRVFAENHHSPLTTPPCPFSPAKLLSPAMDSTVKIGVDGSTKYKIADSRLWYVALAGFLVWQGWLTLGLFGGNNPWDALTDDRPIVSGRHPLHLYHGYLGARSLRERGTTSCYDPAFQAGYPKTPVFDGGSRPAELFLSLAGARFKPGAYKIGFAVCCVLIPGLLWVAGRGMGLQRATCSIATALGILVCWGGPSRELLESGDLDVILSGLASLNALGFLVKFHRDAGLKAWLGLVIAGSVGWYSQPLVFCSLFPLFLVYYFSAGARHGLFWQVALLGSVAAPLLINSFWLFDWLAYWWIRSPIQLEGSVLSHRTLHTLWDAPHWGSESDRILAAVLFSAAALGVLCLAVARERLLARLLGLAVAGSLALVLAGVAFEPFGKMATPRLITPVLWTAALPGAHAVVHLMRIVSRCVGGCLRCGLIVTLCVAVLGFAASSTVVDLARRSVGTTPLSIGLDHSSQEIFDMIPESSTVGLGRILIEETSQYRASSHWTPLLPLLTGRAFIGGLIPDAAIEHSYASLVDQNLAGKPIGTWSDAELTLFCKRYNIDCILCRSPQVYARFRKLPGCREAAHPAGDSSIHLLRFKPGSFFLRGEGRILRCDIRHIALADIVPEDGTVVLSMHYQPGLQASPARVQIERDSDAQDPVPLIRLRIPGPVARITLTWNDEW